MSQMMKSVRWAELGRHVSSHIPTLTVWHRTLESCQAMLMSRTQRKLHAIERRGVALHIGSAWSLVLWVRTVPLLLLLLYMLLLALLPLLLLLLAMSVP